MILVNAQEIPCLSKQKDVKAKNCAFMQSLAGVKLQLVRKYVWWTTCESQRDFPFLLISVSKSGDVQFRCVNWPAGSWRGCHCVEHKKGVHDWWRANKNGGPLSISCYFFPSAAFLWLKHEVHWRPVPCSPREAYAFACPSVGYHFNSNALPNKPLRF